MSSIIAKLLGTIVFLSFLAVPSWIAANFGFLVGWLSMSTIALIMTLIGRGLD